MAGQPPNPPVLQPQLLLLIEPTAVKRAHWLICSSWERWSMAWAPALVTFPELWWEWTSLCSCAFFGVVRPVRGLWGDVPLCGAMAVSTDVICPFEVPKR